MLTTTKIAFATALILGAGSAALANDIDVNPSSAQSAREWAEYMSRTPKHTDNAGNSYGYFAVPTQEENGPRSGKKSSNR
jgi:hypothetical protein